MYHLIGAPWCGACKAIRKKLYMCDIPFRYTEIPAGPKGWEMVEQITGKRAVPAIEGWVLGEWIEHINSLNLPERELTPAEEEELY